MKLARMILPLTMLAGACFAQDIRYNFDKGAVFEKFRTYKWVEVKDAAKLDQLVEQQVKSAIEGELAKKGLTKAPGEDADLWIAYQITLSKEKEFSSYSSYGYGAGWGRGWYGGGMGSTTMTTSTIHIGELALDMYDQAAKQLIWRGTATKTLDANAKPDKRQKNLAKGVAKLLKNYPPPPPKT